MAFTDLRTRGPASILPRSRAHELAAETMAPGPMATATLQAALLGGASNVLEQLMTASRSKAGMRVQWTPVFQFLLFNIVSTPPNYLWQDFLESTFPARPARRGHGKRPDGREPQSPLSLRNTLAKFALDQTAGAAANTLFFSLFMRALQDAMAGPGARVDGRAVLAAARANFWPIVAAGSKFWPVVSLVNFALVRTVAARNLVFALAGVGWGVYMSMVAAQ